MSGNKHPTGTIPVDPLFCCGYISHVFCIIPKCRVNSKIIRHLTSLESSSGLCIGLLKTVSSVVISLFTTFM